MTGVAFFYGQHPPVDLLREFDWVVVQPAALARPPERSAGLNVLFYLDRLRTTAAISPVIPDRPLLR